MTETDRPVSAAPTVEQIAEVVLREYHSRSAPSSSRAFAAHVAGHLAALYPTCQPSLSETAVNLLGLAKQGGIYDGNQAIIALVESLPGRSEAEVKAEALREFASTVELPIEVPTKVRRERYVRQDVKNELVRTADRIAGGEQ